jgi:hypothetical protein
MGGTFANVRPGLAISAGTGSVSIGGVSFLNSGSVTWGGSLSASSLIVTASVSTVAGAAGGIGSISAGTTQITTGGAVLSNSNGISFGVSGQSITAQVGTIHYWDNSVRQAVNPLPIQPQGVLGLQRVSFGAPMAFTRGEVLIAEQVIQNAVGGAGATATGSFSLLMYTLTGQSANLASSATFTFPVPSQNVQASSSSWMSFSLGTWNISPGGGYLLGTLASVSGGVFTGSTFTNFTINAMGGTAPPALGVPGGGNFIPYWANGTLSVTTASAPALVALSAMVQTFSAFVPYQPFVRLIST